MACLLLAVGCLNCNRRHAKDKGTGHGPAKTARAMAEGRRPRRCRLRSRARPLSRSVFVGRERLERVVGLPTLQTDHGETELVQAVKQDLPIRPSRKRCDDNLALSPTRRQSPLPSTPSCFREPPRLRGRERKHRSRPSKYRGQQIVHIGSPLPAFVKSSRPLPDVEKLDFRINHIRDRALLAAAGGPAEPERNLFKRAISTPSPEQSAANRRHNVASSP